MEINIHARWNGHLVATLTIAKLVDVTVWCTGESRAGVKNMTAATSAKGDLEHLRVIVYRESDLYVAQCLEHDIATQAGDIASLLERLDLTIDAECAISKEDGYAPFAHIPAAPNYFHGLWDKRSVTLAHIHMPVGHHFNMEVAYAKAA
jgi:hypothetical protein